MIEVLAVLIRNYVVLLKYEFILIRINPLPAQSSPQNAGSARMVTPNYLAFFALPESESGSEVTRDSNLRPLTHKSGSNNSIGFENAIKIIFHK
jgi:hypothetical protein